MDLLDRLDARLALELTLVGRMALAGVLGFVAGAERELRGKDAGTRTFGLMALGTAGITGLGVELFPVSAEKVIAGVVTGIGFLGAGVIWRARVGQARGLTTAAALWAVAALGVLVGAGLYLAGVLGAALVVGALLLDRLSLFRELGARADDPDPPPPSPE
jgi:putative Mg2+ transporter-C (MgtC) family protein